MSSGFFALIGDSLYYFTKIMLVKMMKIGLVKV